MTTTDHFFKEKKNKLKSNCKGKGEKLSCHFSLLLFSDPDNIKQNAELNISRLFHMIIPIVVSNKGWEPSSLYTL